MPARRRPSSRTPPILGVDYVQRTRAWPVNVLFLAPWIAVYELALLGTRSPVENAAAGWLRSAIRGLDRSHFVLLLLAVTLGLVLVLRSRVREARGDRGVFGGMFVEGICYGGLLGLVASLLAQRMPMGRWVALMPTNEAREAVQHLQVGLRELGLALGAGIFEELVFRGFLLFGAWWVLRRGLGADRFTAAAVAVVGSAWVFSDYHHWGPGGEPYHAGVFAFRFHAGIVLGAIFLTRGLGIAALAHGFYDVLAMWSMR